MQASHPHDQNRDCTHNQDTMCACKPLFNPKLTNSCVTTWIRLMRKRTDITAEHQWAMDDHAATSSMMMMMI